MHGCTFAKPSFVWEKCPFSSWLWKILSHLQRRYGNKCQLICFYEHFFGNISGNLSSFSGNFSGHLTAFSGNFSVRFLFGFQFASNFSVRVRSSFAAFFERFLSTLLSFHYGFINSMVVPVNVTSQNRISFALHRYMSASIPYGFRTKTPININGFV